MPPLLNTGWLFIAAMLAAIVWLEYRRFKYWTGRIGIAGYAAMTIFGLALWVFFGNP